MEEHNSNGWIASRSLPRFAAHRYYSWAGAGYRHRGTTSIAGHVDARMVEYYSHIGTNVKRKAVDRIGETYGPVAVLLGIRDGDSAKIN